MTTHSLIVRSAQLAEYAVSNAINRSTIIDSIAFPEPFAPYRLWYDEFKPAWADYLCTQDFHKSMQGLKDALLDRDAPTDQAEQKIHKVLEAIDQSAKVSPFLELPSARFYKVEDRHRSILMEGVQIRLDCTNISQTAGDSLRVGLVAPYVKSTQRNEPKGVAYLGVLLHWAAELNLAEYGEATPDLCITVNVFGEKIHRAPRSYRAMRKELAALCREISERVSARRAEKVALPEVPAAIPA